MVKKMTLDNLAGMIQRGFAEVARKTDLDSLKTDVGSLKTDLDGVKNNLRILSENNTREHEEIKLRLDNVAYRFESV